VDVTVNCFTYTVPPEWKTTKQAGAYSRELRTLAVQTRLQQNFTQLGTDKHAVNVDLRGFLYSVPSSQWKNVGSWMVRELGTDKRTVVRYTNGQFEGIPDDHEVARTHDGYLILSYTRVVFSDKVCYSGIVSGYDFSTALIEALMEADLPRLTAIRSHLDKRKDIQNRTVGSFVTSYVLCDLLGVPFTQQRMLDLEEQRKQSRIDAEATLEYRSV
jgi:hypothetical protein